MAQTYNVQINNISGNTCNNNLWHHYTIQATTLDGNTCNNSNDGIYLSSSSQYSIDILPQHSNDAIIAVVAGVASNSVVA